MRFAPFALDVPLPPGALIVEASAGTGKTFNIARLVARVLVEPGPVGTDPPSIAQVLVVTFTEAATSELRDRVRAFLVTALADFEAVDAAEGTVPKDPGVAALAGIRDPDGAWTAHPAAERALRVKRLAKALRNFDTAPILTIHGFCQRVLRDLAFESGASFDAELLTDTSALRDELVGDWMAATLVEADADTVAWITGPMKLTAAGLAALAQACVASRGAKLLPESDEDWRPLLADHRRAAQTFAARVRGPEGDAMLAALRGAKLNQQKMSDAKLDDRRAALVSWLEAGALDDLEAGPVFARASVEAAKKKGSTNVESALVDAMEGVLADLAASRARCERALLAEFARWVQSEHRRRVGRAQQQTYDDLLHLVADGLRNEALVTGLRDRYRVALIDEFQDTDAVQWKIFRTIFPVVAEDGTAGRGRMLLIGDPKQAIYGFRGADVRVYAAAREEVPAAQRYSMPTNFRSDGPLVEALNALLGAEPNVFLDGAIGYAPVKAAHAGPRLLDAAAKAVSPLELRWFDAGIVRAAGAGGALSNSDADAALPAVVARDVADALRQGWTLPDDDERTRPLAAGDVAVLTTTNRSARSIQDALVAAGVPAILSSAGSVFATDECGTLVHWLDALSGGGLERPARALVLSPLFGWTVRDLLLTREGHAGDDAQELTDRWTAFLTALRAQRDVLRARGVAAAAERFLSEPIGAKSVSPVLRIAALSDGERRLTNLRHLVELLHTASLAQRLAPRALYAWLVDQRGDALANVSGDETALLRLESDANAVKLLTIHRSKGLEYPVVFLPSLADGRVVRGGRDAGRQPMRFHRANDDALHIDLRGRDGCEPADAAAAKREALEERQRLLYVALTRARHRVVAYVGPLRSRSQEGTYAESPLGLVLHGDGGDDRPQTALRAVSPHLDKNGDPTALRTLIDERLASVPGAVLRDCGTARSAPDANAAWRPHDVLVAPEVFPTTRLVETPWRRESYSGWVGARSGGLRASEAVREEGGGDDEAGLEGAADAPMPDAAVERLREPLDDAPSDAPEVPMTGFPGGREAGRWFHGVFEDLSFPSGAPTRDDETLDALIRRHGARNGFDTGRGDAVLASVIPAILDTPLGAAAGGARLRDIADGDRLSEVKFDLAVAGGDDWDRATLLTGAALARRLGAVPAESPLPSSYFAFLGALSLEALAGFFTGTLDLVVRVPVDGHRRWFICDYKTNRLGPRASGQRFVMRSCAPHYGQAWMAQEVVRHDYYLQYLFYTVALHRYLRARLGAAYDYDRDMGGALYLFVRGMHGAQTASDDRGRVHGVFHDRPDRRIVEDLSALFADPTGGAR